MNTTKLINNISTKEKDSVLSLFRIPLNFFSLDSRRNNFHKKLAELKKSASSLPVSTQELEKVKEADTRSLDESSIQNANNEKFTYDPDFDGDDDKLGHDMDFDGNDDKIGHDTDFDGNDDKIGHDTDFDGDDDKIGHDTDFDDDDDGELEHDPDFDDDDDSDDSKDDKKESNRENKKETDKNKKDENTEISDKSDASNNDATGDSRDNRLKDGKASDIPKSTPNDVAKDTAKGAGKDAAMNTAKDVGKDAAKDAGKELAKDAGKNAGKELAKDAGKNAGKELAKGATNAAPIDLDTAKNAIKDAANGDATGAAGQLAVEGAKVAADAVVPGAGKVIDVVDKTIGKTETGKKAKRCCGGCLGGICLGILALPILLIIIVLIPIGGLFNGFDNDSSKVSAAAPKPTIFELLETYSPSNNDNYPYENVNKLLAELDKYEYPNYATLLGNQYSIKNLKGPSHNTTSSGHMALFEDVLNNDAAETKALLTDLNTGKFLFIGESANSFINSLIDDLSKSFSAYNPKTKATENMSLKSLFGEVSDDYMYIQDIFNDKNNEKFSEHFKNFQYKLGKLELLVYTQAVTNYAKYSRDLPDTYSNTDEFFEKFSTITDVSSYISMSMTTKEPSLIYEIAAETIRKWRDTPTTTTTTLKNTEEEEITCEYIPTLDTWYATYEFEGVLDSDETSAVANCISANIKRPNLLEKYQISNQKSFFSVYESITGTKVVELEESSYVGVTKTVQLRRRPHNLRAVDEDIEEVTLTY